MRTVRETVIVQAPPEAVWEVLVDPYYAPKLYPDVVNMTADPPGRAAVGQRRVAGAKAGKRLIELRTQVVDIVPLARFELGGLPGGAFEEFSEVIELEPAKEGTRLKVKFYFKVSESYFEQGSDLLTLEQLAVMNQQNFIKNLKVLSELKEV